VLARDVPDNRELRKFLTTYDSTTLVINPVDRASWSHRPRVKEFRPGVRVR
jgi:hypothetical protein